jgi:hypothetical protein
MQSTLDGTAGLEELLAFAGRLGLRGEWIQHQGSPKQHFDLTAAKRALAVRLGAVEVSRGEAFTELLRGLHEGRNDDQVPS